MARIGRSIGAVVLGAVVATLLMAEARHERAWEGDVDSWRSARTSEVLQGFRTDTGFQQARKVLVSLPMIHPDLACHVRAARLFRTLRRRGVTLRGAVDCVIAQTCLDVGAELLSPDADFKPIARHTALQLWRA